MVDDLYFGTIVGSDFQLNVWDFSSCLTSQRVGHSI